MARRLGHHGDVVAGHVLEHQHLAEHAALFQPLQNGAAALMVNALDDGGALCQDAHHVSPFGEIVDQLAGAERVLPHVKAGTHGLQGFLADIPEQRRCTDVHALRPPAQPAVAPPSDDAIDHIVAQKAHHEAGHHVDDRVLLDE